MPERNRKSPSHSTEKNISKVWRQAEKDCERHLDDAAEAKSENFGQIHDEIQEWLVIV